MRHLPRMQLWHGKHQPHNIELFVFDIILERKSSTTYMRTENHQWGLVHGHFLTFCAVPWPFANGKYLDTPLPYHRGHLASKNVYRAKFTIYRYHRGFFQSIDISPIRTGTQQQLAAVPVCSSTPIYLSRFIKILISMVLSGEDRWTERCRKQWGKQKTPPQTN